MRIGVFSDTHANIEALQAVQKALDDEQVDRRVCLGDTVGYRPIIWAAAGGFLTVAVTLGLESDEIIGQHRLDQLAMVRHPLHDVGSRPWRVQEKSDRIDDAEIAEFRPKRQEMIILHPERGVRLVEAQ